MMNKARPSLRWGRERPMIQTYLHQAWFVELDKYLVSDSAVDLTSTPVVPVNKSWRRDVYEIFTEESPHKTYLEFVVPENLSSVGQIVFRMVSHDQSQLRRMNVPY